MRFVLFVALTFFYLVLSLLPVTAGPIYEDFKKTEENIRKAGLKKANITTLEGSLLMSLKHALKLYHGYKPSQPLTIQDIKYEVSPTESYTYYVRYKGFLGYFTYYHDPSHYLQLPIKEKIIIKSGYSSKLKK